MSISSHPSNRNDGNINVMKEFNINKKISSNFNRYKFLKECLAEMVLPKSAPTHLHNSRQPFSAAARAYLEDACTDLKDKLYELKNDLIGVRLPDHLKAKLTTLNERQRSNLSQKLKLLCNNSKWKSAGNVDIVTNLAMRPLTSTEKEALSLGLKFDSGKDRFTFVEHVDRNYKWDDSDAEKGFMQGILAVCKALADKEPGSLPRRYIKALENLAVDKNIVVTQADKGGGVVIIDSSEYRKKLNDLLADAETYVDKQSGFAAKESVNFNKKVRKILRRSDKGKKLLHLLEESPKAPRLRGLPKVHKAGLPMRPIISGIGSAPHKLAKVLAKPLTAALGTISGTHIRNTSEMMDLLKDIDMSGKQLASFDVKSLFTNVPVEGALEAIREVVDLVDERTLPVPKLQYLELISLCMHFNAFSFKGQEYAQISGLAMGSPLSPVAACFYLERLEEKKFKDIMGPTCTWIRYIDDVLIVTQDDVNLDDKLNALNAVDQKIQFTVEKESGGKIPFLDTMIMRHGSTAKFSVYRKPTNKEDYVHFFSGHSERVKSGIVIGFFLRAFRICSEEFLEDEFDHIFSAFRKLQYPKGYLIQMKKKAEQIRERSTQQKRDRKEEQKKRGRFISIPYSKQADTIAHFLRAAGSNVAIVSGKKIGNLIRPRTTKPGSDSVVYKIPCSGTCSKAYVGETGRGLQTRLKEHRRDVRNHNRSNAMVLHIEQCQRLPDWEGAEVIEEGMSKTIRKAMEAAHILVDNTLNSKPGFFTWSKSAAKIVLKTK